MVISPDFSGPGIALAVLVVGYLVTVEPWWGRRAYARLERGREQDPSALVRFFGLTLAAAWSLAAATAVIIMLSPGARFADVGLVTFDVSGDLVSSAAGLALALVLSTLLFRWIAKSGGPVPGQEPVRAMLPRTRSERWLALAVSVSAGICEELVYRGLLIALGVGVFGLDVKIAAAAALLIFAVAHLYQGARGMVLVTVLGLALTWLYLKTGSLLLPIVVHALIDVRGLLLVPASAASAPEDAGGERSAPVSDRSAATRGSPPDDPATG